MALSTLERMPQPFADINAEGSNPKQTSLTSRLPIRCVQRLDWTLSRAVRMAAFRTDFGGVERPQLAGQRPLTPTGPGHSLYFGLLTKSQARSLLSMLG
jgi:hypothetical protein